MRKALVCLFITALLLGACATLPAQEQGTPVEESSTPVHTQPPLPPTSGTQDKPEPAELPEGAVLVFQRSGGFAGVNEVWTLYADGRLTKSDHDQPEAEIQEWQVEPEEVMALLEKIDSLGFFSMQASVKPGEVCCDRFAYSLAASYHGTSRELSAVEGTAGIPEAYWQVISEVNTFLQSVAK